MDVINTMAQGATLHVMTTMLALQMMRGTCLFR